MQLLEYQIILGIIAPIIGLIGSVPYFRSMLKKETKPHAFSWLIWGTIQAVIFFAQTSNNGGAGAWTVGVGAIFCFTVFAFALFEGEKEITNLDKTSLIVAIFGIALWIITTNPVYSVIILTGVDVVGFIPTFRKSYKKPQEEAASLYAFGAISFGMSIFALQTINITTALYPASVVFTNTLFVITVLRWRLVKLGRRRKRT